MSEKNKQCCERCINYEPIAIGIDCIQFHNFCVEHQCHVNPKSNGCNDFKTIEIRDKSMEQED